jgi:hypothetical protein
MDNGPLYQAKRSGKGTTCLLNASSARDADPGALLRRRRREVALACYVTRNIVTILDAYPTLTLRLPDNHLTNWRFFASLVVLHRFVRKSIKPKISPFSHS